MSNTIVAIGCSTHPDYAPLAPLTAMLWREHVGFEPRLYLVGSEAEWEGDARVSVCLHAIRQLDIRHRFAAHIPGYEDATIAQNVRQHAAADSSIPDDAWLMPGDADLWPIRRSYYHRHEDFAGLAVCYNADGDHFKSREDVLARAAEGLNSATIPTCHVAMRASEWREIYGLLPDQIEASIKQTLDAWLTPRVQKRPTYAAGLTWMSDQQIMTEKLCGEPWFPAMARMIHRHDHPPIDRLDRMPTREANWDPPFDPWRWIDAHLRKEPLKPEHWASTLRIVDALLPRRAEWVRRYGEELVHGSR